MLRPGENGFAGQGRSEMGEEVGRHPLARPLRIARRKDAALGVDDMGRRDADRACCLQDALDDAGTVAMTGAAAGQFDDGRAQFGFGGQLFRLVPALGDPLVQGLDLRVEQGGQAGRADFTQGIADTAIGPQADAEDGGEQQEQGEAGAVERECQDVNAERGSWPT